MPTMLPHGRSGPEGEGVRRTGWIQHPLDGTSDVSARPANDELEAIVRDKGYEFGAGRGH